MSDKKIIREKIWITTEDKVKLNGWFFPAQKEKKLKQPKAMILFFHGNAQNISSHFLNLYWLTENSYDYLLFDYRSYGSSEGEIDNDLMLKDIQAMYLYARAEADRKKIPLYLYGQSLGGVLLLKYLTENLDASFDDLIIEGSFFSFSEMAKLKSKESWLLWPFQWLTPILVSDKNSLDKEKLSQLKGRKVILHSKKDPVVTFSQGERIFQSLSEPKEFWTYDVRSHVSGTSVNKGHFRKKLLKRWQGFQD